MSSFSFEKMIGRKVFIIGEVGTGKTWLTKKLLMEAIELGHSEDITVLEMAPNATRVNELTVGGELLDFHHQLRILRGREIKTPRLSARNAAEIYELADHNLKEVERLLEEFICTPTKILFVNDISIYLQRGDLDRLWTVFGKAETVVANGYRGEKLKSDFGTGISEREERLMSELASKMDVVICL